MDYSENWKEIFDEISTADQHIKGTINYYNLASILEDLYVENAELKARVELLEKRLLENDLNFEGCYD
jgi:regulator of replication initiation timing